MDEWKHYIEKRLLKMFFEQKMKSWCGKDTYQNTSARFLTLLIFAVRWALCGRPQPKHESVMPLLSLSPSNCGRLVLESWSTRVIQYFKDNTVLWPQIFAQDGWAGETTGPCSSGCHVAQFAHERWVWTRGARWRWVLHGPWVTW